MYFELCLIFALHSRYNHKYVYMYAKKPFYDRARQGKNRVGGIFFFKLNANIILKRLLY